MLEENTPADPNAQKPIDPETVQIGKSELEQYQKAKQLYDKVKANATLYGDDYDPDEYFNDLEGKAKEALEYEDELKKLKSETKPESKPSEPVKKEPALVTAPAVFSEAQLKHIQQLNANSTMALMDSHYTRFVIAQSKLPEDKQSPHTREQLMKVIADEGPVIGRVLKNPKHSGNVFEAANYLLNFDKIQAEESKNTANRDAALNKAKETANIDSSTGKVISDEDSRTENDKAADEIAEDDTPVALTQ